MTTSDLVLIDTNILIYAADTTSSFHATASTILERGAGGVIPICISPQVLFEFFSVITNPKRVETAWTAEKAVRAMDKYYRAKGVGKIYPAPDAPRDVLDLLRTHEVKGRGIFDLHLVVTMLSNGVNRICTYNEKDFSKFSEVEVLSPEKLIG